MADMESNAPRMPSVIGMSVAQAQAVISTAVADPQVTIQHSDPGKVPHNMVIGQRPAAGNEVASGSHIELTVSTRPGPQERRARTTCSFTTPVVRVGRHGADRIGHGSQINTICAL